MKATVIGAGLAGSEAAWQLAQAGVTVELYEMRPTVSTNAHQTALCAELVCSNSLRGAALSNAVGLLKEELRLLNSLIMQSADAARIPAGGALAVDRDLFSSTIDQKVRNHPLVNFYTNEVTQIPPASKNNPVIIASGPLTSQKLSLAIENLLGSQSLAFYDAISPIVTVDSVDHQVVFRQSRYDKGDGSDYLNVPLSKEIYQNFVADIRAATIHEGNIAVENENIDSLRPFEGCMPIEDMATRGEDTLLFGPLKPVGLTDPQTGRRPHAVLQLRQDNTAGTLWNMVGMQTRMKHPDQIRIFRKLPGLQNAEFVRLGSVHRNTFINSPTCLKPTLECKMQSGLFFAGQVTGTEGYVESTSGGFVAAINAIRYLRDLPLVEFPIASAIGSLIAYITEPTRKDFQPMNINFGLMANYMQQAEKKQRRSSKKERRLTVAKHALDEVEKFSKTMLQ